MFVKGWNLSDIAALKELYDDQYLTFLVKTRILFEYVKKTNWEIKTPHNSLNTT